jgi:2-desacetyl-2-hydroxyethyl bacteriochlorophyllide A dehydrogenase
MAKALWFLAPGRVEVREQPLPEPGASDLLVRGLFSAVSWGTERHLYQGTAPSPFDPSLDEPNAPVYPRRYGYAWVGEVEAGPLAPGTRVFALASHAEAHVLHRAQVRPLPEHLPARRATLAASLETALTAVWDSRLVVGERVMILGGGTIGASCAYVALRAGAQRVCLVEPDATRAARARALGVSDVLAPTELDAQQAPAEGFDVVVEATGDPGVLDTAIACARREGRVVVASFYGRRVANVSLGARFHRERLTLISSQVSVVPEHLRARFDHDRRFGVVLDLLDDERLDALLDAPVPFCDAPRAYARAAEGSHQQIVFAY